jgi:tetratricopeptide (TPR) repeat protein
VGRAQVPARLPDDAATVFHVQNVIWHAAASAAFFLLVAELFGGLATPALAAALFAVHPVHTEAVDGIVGRAELIAAAFSFLTLVLAIKIVRDEPEGCGPAVGAGAALFAALLAKEQAIVVPLVFVMGVALQGTARHRDPWTRRNVRRVLTALLIATACYLGARVAVLHSVTGTASVSAATPDVDNPVATAGGAARWLTPLRVFGEVLRLVVMPKTLSADYSYDQIPIVRSLDLATAACGVALVGLVFAVFGLRRVAPAIAYGLGFFLLTWVLTSNVFLRIGTILGERLLYLPSAGVCLIAASLAVAAGTRLRAPWLSAGIGAVLVLAGAGRTAARNVDWKSNLTLFEATTKTSPRSCKAANGYAAELYARGELPQARLWAERALSINPAYPEAHGTLAKIDRASAGSERDPAAKRSLQDQAREHARAVLATTGDGAPALRADAWSVLGAIALDQGELAAAEEALRNSLALQPDDSASLEGLGVVLASRARAENDPGRREALNNAALGELKRAIDLDPGHVEALQNAATTLRQLATETSDPALASARVRQADAYENRALALAPGTADPAAAANLHGLRGQRLLAEKRFDEALAEFRQAQALTPRAARAYLGIGTALASLAEAASDPGSKSALLTDAIAAFTQAVTLEPDNPDAQLDLGIVLLRARRDPVRAAEALRTYLRLVPDAPMRAQLEQTIRSLR